jgi:uncharacterized membrane protein
LWSSEKINVLHIFPLPIVQALYLLEFGYMHIQKITQHKMGQISKEQHFKLNEALKNTLKRNPNPFDSLENPSSRR